MVRSYDPEGHIEHISLVFQRFPFPLATACWECYHPPLYYSLAGALYWCVQKSGYPDPDKVIQGFSLAIHFIFLAIALALLRGVFTDPARQLTASAILLFWPCSFIHGARIGNDVAFYAIHAGALFLLWRWRTSGKQSMLIAASWLGIAALLTKANGAVTLALIYITVLLCFFEQKDSRPKLLGSAAKVTAIFALGAGLFSIIVWLKGGMLSNAVGLSPALRVENTWSHFLLFKPDAYFGAPFISTFVDATGRQFFWNLFFKTSLFGEFTFSNPIAVKVAPYLDCLVLILFAYCVAGFVICLRSKTNLRVLALNAVLLLAALIANRWLLPYACSGDFRYIYPCIISGAVFYTETVSLCKDRGLRFLMGLGYFLLILFLFLGLVCIGSVIVLE